MREWNNQQTNGNNKTITSAMFHSKIRWASTILHIHVQYSICSFVLHYIHTFLLGRHNRHIWIRSATFFTEKIESKSNFGTNWFSHTRHAFNKKKHKINYIAYHIYSVQLTCFLQIFWFVVHLKRCVAIVSNCRDENVLNAAQIHHWSSFEINRRIFLCF